MEFKRVGDEGLRVLLTGVDMMRLGVSYEGLDYANEETRAAILTLLEAGCLETDFDPGEARLFVEAYPWEDGCALYFTPLWEEERGRRPKAKKAVCSPLIYAFGELDTVIEGAVRLFALYCHRIYKSSLYRLGEEYRLILYPFDPGESHTALFLSEYGRRVGAGEIAAALVREHGEAVIEHNAIDKLAYYLTPGRGGSPRGGGTDVGGTEAG